MIRPIVVVIMTNTSNCKEFLVLMVNFLPYGQHQFINVVRCKETLLLARTGGGMGLGLGFGMGGVGERVANNPEELQTSAHFCRKSPVVNHKPQAENWLAFSSKDA